MLGVSRYTSSFSTMDRAVGLDIGKYNNLPHSDNGIRKLVTGNNMEQSSTVRSLTCIFGVSCTLNTSSISKKVGSRLFFIEGTFREFLTSMMYIFPS